MTASSTLARALAAVGLVALLAGFAWAISPGLGDGDAPAPAPTQAAAPKQPAATTQPKAKAKPKPKAVRVPLVATGAYDPEGDGRENDAQVALAVDGDETTAWSTERYSSFFKDGVGLVLDAGKAVRASKVVLTSDTPGFVAEIRVGTAPGGPFTQAARGRTIGAKATFTLGPRTARYLLVWITDIPGGGTAHVSEVRLTAVG